MTKGSFYKKSLLLYNERNLMPQRRTDYMGNHERSLREKSIVFVGFMGVGKTTIGKLVAKKLYRDFVDTDEEIEKEFGMPTTKIASCFFWIYLLTTGKKECGCSLIADRFYKIRAWNKLKIYIIVDNLPMLFTIQK
jgi:hypothetical protein